MAIDVTHSTPADGTFSAAGAIAWDDSHVLNMATGHILGRTTAGTGSVEEVPIGTGVATALGVAVGSAGAFVVNGGALGTPSSGTLTNATGLPIGGLTGLGTGVGTALAVNVGSAGAFVTFNGALGTPSSGTLTNATGLPISSGVSGLGTSVATALAVNVGSAGAFTTNNAANTFTASQTFNAATSSIYLGANGGNLGVVTLYGNTSGSVTLKPAAAAGTGTVFQLPANNGTSGYVLQTDGAGVTSWAAAAGGSPGGSSGDIQYNNAGAFGGSILKQGTNIIEQYSSTSAQTYRIYNTYTDASNYERANLAWASNVFKISTANAGTGTLRAMVLSAGTAGVTCGSWNFGDQYTSGYTTAAAAEAGTLTARRMLIELTSGGGATYLAADGCYAFTSSGGGGDVGASINVGIRRISSGVMGVRGSNASIGASFNFLEQTAPAAPSANQVTIYAEDNGSGKTRLMALFNTGAAQVIATEP